MVPYATALAERFRIDWPACELPRPRFLGTRQVDVPLDQLIPFIDWSPFFMAWELKGKFPKILDDPKYGSVARELFDDAQQMLQRLVAERRLTARGIYGFWPAARTGTISSCIRPIREMPNSAGFTCLDNSGDGKARPNFARWPTTSRRIETGQQDYLGAFAVTAGLGAVSWRRSSRLSTTT